MSFEPDVAYLAPDFDPASLTVPRLRSILVEYDVPYPASAKKSDLIELFNKSVASKAKQLLKSHSRTKRSARGIEDVPSSQDSTVDEEDEDTILPKPPKTTRSTRRSMRAGTADTEMSTASRTSTARAPAKKMSTKHALPADAEPDLRPAVRRSRNSVQREIKEENTEPETWHRHDAESPFTADNPFQSGSSPPAPESKDYRRRTTLGHVKERPKSSSRRRTEGVPTRPQAKDGIIVPSRKTFEVSFKKTKKEESVDDHGVVAGEEFTPEEQLELIRERAKAGQADILPSRRRKHRSSGVSTAAPVSILMILLSVLAFLWRQEKLEVGYCGVGKGESTSLAGQEIPEWAREFLPSCEACPSHAICYSDLKTECEKDFVLRPHPLSIGGVVPLPPTCEPDSEKARRIKSVADRATMKLRERNAAFECGEKDKSGHHVKSPEMTEEELRSVTSQGLSKKWSQAEFDELWKGAIDDIVQRDEIKAGPVGLRSHSLTAASLGCSLRRSLLRALVTHSRKLLITLLIPALALYSRHRVSSSRATEARAKTLAGSALDRLATHAAMHAMSPGAVQEPWLGMAQLRDDVLREEFSEKRRVVLWERVRKLVEGNANVRPMVREGRSGDVGRVWEWVGPLATIEDTPARRESGRFGASGSAENSVVKNEEVRKWDEGRPVY